MQLTKSLRRRQRGMSIIEILIGTAIMGVILAGALRLQTQADDQTSGRNSGDALASFQQLAGQYFIANRTSFETAMGGDATAQSTYCLINVAADGTGGTVAANSTKRTCAFDPTLLRAKSLWPTGMPVDVNGSRYVAIVRQIMTTGGSPVPTGADEMLIVLAPESGGNVMTSGTVTFTGDVRRAADAARAAMAAMGGMGGFIPPGQDYGPCQYNGTTKQVCGTGWTVTLSNFIN